MKESKIILISILFIFSKNIFGQIEDTIGLIKVYQNKITKSRIIFNFSEKEDSIYNVLLNKIDNLKLYEKNLQIEIDSLKSEKVKENIVYDYLGWYNSTYNSRLHYYIKYIKNYGMLPIPTLSDLPNFRNRAITENQLLEDIMKAFFISPEFKDCNFFSKNEIEKNIIINLIVYSSHNLTNYIEEKYNFSTSCHKENLKLILNELKDKKN